MTPLLALEYVLRQGRVPPGDVQLPSTSWGLRHAVARLRRALVSAEFGLDHAVLLRQCLRLLPHDQFVAVESVAPNVKTHFEAVSLTRAIDGTINALPLLPQWLAGPAPLGVDVPAQACVLDDDSLPGEAWLSDRLGKHNWRSQAQREAAWNALTAPPNSTLLVGLPTGAGKSLVYQVCTAFDSGLTIVVVPTVALGLDQIKALSSMPIAKTHNPMLYTADEHAAAVLDAVKSRQCRLLITSPEAIVAGRLGPVLRTLAHEAWLSRLVIDEAHIVDSWGASFRVEFQLLAAHLREWRSVAPNGIRTLLLSATFGSGTPDMLHNLFASDGVAWERYVIQRLRPEIHYFSPGRPLDPTHYEGAVKHALLHLARPAILYVTERKDADEWTIKLRQMGFARLACFHGSTGQRERARILDAWREDQLDLVVATSAFGMGVDKPDIRAVVHACFPENIDRYYQEVGRGGRDGAASVAVALWTDEDRQIGGSMGPKLLSDQRKIQGRWNAMWDQRETASVADHFKVPIWVAPDYKLHERTYDESVNWNKRLLLMMERGGLLTIDGLEVVPSEDQQDRREWAVVQMLCGTTNLAARLPGLLQQTRAGELKALDAGRRRLDELLSNRVPVCRTLREQYGRPTYRACGSCAPCRHEPALRAGTVPLVLRLQQRRTRPRVDIVHGPSPAFKKDEGYVVMALRRVIQAGLSWRFVTGERFHGRVSRLLETAGARNDGPYRLDLLTGETAKSIRPEEIVVCLHDQVIHAHAALLHAWGTLCAHWILGASSEDPGGRWPFLHERQSRLFSGPEALNDWITSRLELRQQPRELERVHR